MIDIDNIIECYNSGGTIQSISKSLRKGSLAISNILKERGVVLRKRGINLTQYQKYTCNETYFKIIDSEDKAYFLGLIYADGHIQSSKQTFTIKLAEQDKYILELLKSYLNSNSPIKKVLIDVGQDQFKLSIYNRTFIDNLENCGIQDNKTYNCIFPDCIPDHLMNHFIRGYFDGDGCITITQNKGTFSIIGTKSFIQDLAKVLLKNCDLTLGFTVEEKENKYYTISKRGSHNLTAIRDYLYKDATIFLTRKKDKFDGIKTIKKRYNLKTTITNK